MPANPGGPGPGESPSCTLRAELSSTAEAESSPAEEVDALLVLAAGGLILWAFRTKPGGYTLEQIPEAFFTVLGQIIR